MPRWLLRIAYDGTDFHGWQRQVIPETHPYLSEAARAEAVGTGIYDPSRPRLMQRLDGTVELRTVQGAIEDAVRGVVRQPVSVRGASRTDTGVHAAAQVCAFSCDGEESVRNGTGGWPTERGGEALMRAMNSRLPDDVLVTHVQAVDESFDPIGDCVGKGYSYTFYAGARRPMWERRTVTHVRERLNVEAMREAAGHFVGEHDFAGFAQAGHGRETTVRTVFGCGVKECAHDDASAQRVRIDISGNGFLWNMVRIVAGTLYDVGRGRIEAGELPTIIASCDRSRAGPTSGASGLRLEWIEYPSPIGRGPDHEQPCAVP